MIVCGFVEDSSAGVAALELIERVDAAAKLLDVVELEDPWPDPLLYHVVLVFAAEGLPLLIRVLLTVELRVKIFQLIRDEA